MKISPEEQAAIRTVIDLGERYGFGNLIQHLRTAWIRHLMTEWGASESSARAAAGDRGYPLKMQDDLIERGEWDETGARYQCPNCGQKSGRS